MHHIHRLAILAVAAAACAPIRSGPDTVVRSTVQTDIARTVDTKVDRDARPGGRPGGLGDCDALDRRARAAAADGDYQPPDARCAGRDSLVWTRSEIELTDGRRIPAATATLHVPERRSNTSARRIGLHLIKLPATRATTGSGPLLFLDGAPDTGPSSSTIRIPSLFAFFDSLRGSRDVILMDYRGSGQSTPLRCPSIDRMPADLFESRETAMQFYTTQARRCAESARADGIDLTGYTWAEVAADVDDVRAALGVPSLDLLGFSSGTHAALATLKYHGNGIGRVVLIGTEGLDHTRKLPSNIDRQLTRIAQLVRADSSMARSVPDLLGTMRRTIDRAEQRPFVVRVRSAAGDSIDVAVGRMGLSYLAAKSISGPEEFAGLVQLFATLGNSDTNILRAIIQRMFARPMAPHALIALLDGSAGVSPARERQIAAETRTSVLGDAASFPYPDVRDAWGYRDLGDDYRAPFRTSVPALFITGELDGNTPPHQADEVRAAFTRSTHLVVANAGHSTPFRVPGVVAAIAAFLDGEDVSGRKLAAPPVRLSRPR